MKTVRLSYLHLSNILSSRVEFSNRVVKSSFSIWFDLSNSTSQLNSTLFQKNFNSTQHFSSRVLDLNSSTRLDAISLICLSVSFIHFRFNCKDVLHSFDFQSLLNVKLLQIQRTVISITSSDFQEFMFIINLCISFYK